MKIQFPARLPALMFLLTMLTATLMLTACGGESPSTPPSTQAASQAAPAPTTSQTEAQPAAATAAPAAPAQALPSDPKAAVIAAVGNQLTAGPYRVRTTIDTGDGVSEMLQEVIPPDRMHMTSQFDSDEGMEMIVIGAQGWMKTGDAWVAAPEMASVTQQTLAQDSAELAAMISDAEDGGAADLNGVATHIYRFTTTMGEGADAISSTATVWVDTARGLPVQQESEAEFGGVKSKTTQVIEYDPTIVISPPPGQ